MANIEKSVEQITAEKIKRILELSNEGQRKAVLANLRRGAGRPPGELPELWGEFLEEMSGDPRWNTRFGANMTGPSPEEWAVYTAMTLFAIHQQGHDPAKDRMHTDGVALGTAAAQCAIPDGGDTSEDARKALFERVRRRFNIAATSENMEKLSWHLRGLVQIMSSKSVSLDYGLLARDLYLYQNPAMRNGVRLQWGRDLYREYYRAVSNGGKDEGEANG